MESQRKVLERSRGGEEEGSESGSVRERGLWRVWGHVRRGVEHASHPDRTLPEHRLGQMAHGFSLPFQLVRVLLASPQTRWRYLRVSVLQATLVVALGVLFTGSSQEVVDSVGDEAEQHMDQDRPPAQWEQEYQVAIGEATALAVEKGWDRAARAEFKRSVRQAQEARERARGEPRRGVAHWLVYAAALLSSLQLAQWIVTALGRDFHTALSREASLLTGVPPEDEPLTPRVRLNLGWLRTKIKRRWRGLVVLALGLPLLWALSRVLPGSAGFFTVLVSLWGAWWFMVFTAGKSALAWNEQAPRDPWFLRGWTRVSTYVVPLRVYGSLWRRFTQSVFSPAASVEQRPWSFGGLALARALAVLPVIKCFLRPVIPVAAAHLLLAGQESPAQGREGTEGSAAPSPNLGATG